MAKKKVTDEEKLRNKIIQNVNSRRNFLNRDGYRDAKDSFIEKFILTEIAVKSILADYYKKKGENKEVESIEMGITTIKAALKMAGYAIDDDIVDKMYKAKQKRGVRSARDLRNGIVHDLNVKDIQEVFDRKTELDDLLNTFLDSLLAPFANTRG